MWTGTEGWTWWTGGRLALAQKSTYGTCGLVIVSLLPYGAQMGMWTWSSWYSGAHEGTWTMWFSMEWWRHRGPLERRSRRNTTCGAWRSCYVAPPSFRKWELPPLVRSTIFFFFGTLLCDWYTFLRYILEKIETWIDRTILCVCICILLHVYMLNY
jgi:hypothetical protein